MGRPRYRVLVKPINAVKNIRRYYPYEARDRINSSQLIYSLENIEKAHELVDIFEQYSICIVNPLPYTRLAADIPKAAGLSIEELVSNNYIVEMML